MFRVIFSFIFCSFIVIEVAAQDFHFSQYWASPSYVNPALTGFFKKNLKFTTQYRNQWIQTNAYSTYSATIDANLWRAKMQGNFVGIALSFYQDLEGNAAFTNTAATLSVAYHLQLGKRKLKHSLALGFSAIYFSKQINLRNAIYGNSFQDNNNFDPIQSYAFDAKNFADIALGINYFITINKYVQLNTGVSVSHLANPNISFNEQTQDTLFRKYSFQSNVKIDFQNTKLSIIPLVLFQNQGPHTELGFGTYLKYTIPKKKPLAIYFGMQYRMVSSYNYFGSDAFILALRTEFNDLDIGFSYDFTISPLSQSKALIGGPELYISYAIGFKNNKNQAIACPKF